MFNIMNPFKTISNHVLLSITLTIRFEDLNWIFYILCIEQNNRCHYKNIKKLCTTTFKPLTPKNIILA